MEKAKIIHPQIAQIFTDWFDPAANLICANLRNLWISPFVPVI